ncbi:MAG: CmcI family methyltransferase [Pseudomonadota bacterium]
MRKVNAIDHRLFAVDLPQPALDSIQNGTRKIRYKGLRFCKNPFDIVLYLKILEALKPQTIIEFGTSEGGSAVWFSDQCVALGLNTEIHSFDLKMPAVTAQNVTFHEADAYRPADTISATLLESLPHPWLVIEDSAHTFEACLSVMQFFRPFILSGDYLVIEDGVVADLSDEQYRAFEDGPNRAVSEFLKYHGDQFEIDETYCDFFGHNVTYCPNGWLRRI